MTPKLAALFAAGALLFGFTIWVFACAIVAEFGPAG